MLFLESLYSKEGSNFTVTSCLTIKYSTHFAHTNYTRLSWLLYGDHEGHHNYGTMRCGVSYKINLGDSGSWSLGDAGTGGGDWRVLDLACVSFSMFFIPFEVNFVHVIA